MTPVLAGSLRLAKFLVGREEILGCVEVDYRAVLKDPRLTARTHETARDGDRDLRLL